jgi:hypothetical protein
VAGESVLGSRVYGLRRKQGPTISMDRSFLLIFLKKEALPCFPALINEESLFAGKGIRPAVIPLSVIMLCGGLTVAR